MTLFLKGKQCRQSGAGRVCAGIHFLGSIPGFHPFSALKLPHTWFVSYCRKHRAKISFARLMGKIPWPHMPPGGGTSWQDDRKVCCVNFMPKMTKPDCQPDSPVSHLSSNKAENFSDQRHHPAQNGNTEKNIKDYLLEQWPYLVRYLEDGRLERSNNRAERSIKPFVMGRRTGCLPIRPPVRRPVL